MVGRHVVRLWREHQLRRGRLPRLREVRHLPRAREGVFRLGVCSGGGELCWDPWGVDPPHLLVTGTTGGGKSRLMETMALVALDWGWDVVVVDAKGGGDFWAAISHGARVVSTPKETTRTLVEAADDIAARNALMLRTPVLRERIDGQVLEDRATTLRDLPRAVRAEHDLRPRLVLVDETASILEDKKEAMPALRRAVQLGRSAGVHLVLGLQRPDADLLPGFLKHNVQGRVLFGPADQVTEQMVMGSAVAGLDDVERAAPRPAGRALASGIGGRPIARFQAFLLDRDTYLPFHRSPALLGPDSGPGVASQGSRPSSPTAGSGGSPDAPGASSSPAPAASPGPLGGPASAGSSSPRPRRLAAVRPPWLVGPLARVRLRLGALRCLVGPVRSGPFDRDPDLAEACKRAAGWRCCACGAGPPVQADHRRPLWASGKDSAENLRCLCVRCHAAATRVQTTIRAWRRRSGRLGRVSVARPPAWQIMGGLCLLAGAVDGRFRGWAMLVFGLTLIGPMLWRAHAPAMLRRGRSGGLDGVGEWEKRLESERRGWAGVHTRSYYRVRYAGWSARIALMGMSGAYLAGWWLPRAIL